MYNPLPCLTLFQHWTYRLHAVWLSDVWWENILYLCIHCSGTSWVTHTWSLQYDRDASQWPRRTRPLFAFRAASLLLGSLSWTVMKFRSRICEDHRRFLTYTRFHVATGCVCVSVWVGAFIILECGIIIRGWNWTSHSRANLKPHRLQRHWLETRSALGKQEWLINVWMSCVDTRWKTTQQIVIFFSIAQRSLDCHGSPGNCITKIIEVNGENLIIIRVRRAVAALVWEVPSLLFTVGCSRTLSSAST